MKTPLALLAASAFAFSASAFACDMHDHHDAKDDSTPAPTAKMASAAPTAKHDNATNGPKAKTANKQSKSVAKTKQVAVADSRT